MLARGEFDQPEALPPPPPLAAGRARRDGHPRSACWASSFAARSTTSPTCAATSSACSTSWRTPSSSSAASGRLVFASGAVEKFLGKRAAGPARASRCPISSRPTPRWDCCWRRPRRPAGRCTTAACPSSATAKAARGGAALGGDPGEPAGRSRHRPHAGMLVRLRDPEATQQISRAAADGRPALRHQPHHQRRGARGEEPAQRHPLHVEVARMKLAPRRLRRWTPQMEIISREILRLDRVVKTFLDFTRPLELNLAEVPVDELRGRDRGTGAPAGGGAQASSVNVLQEAAGRGGARGPRPDEAGRAERRGERHRGHAGGRRAALRGAGARTTRPRSASPTPARASRRSCGRRSSGCTSRPRRRAPASGWP